MEQFDILVDELIDLAIREDVGDGDHSSLSCIPLEKQGKVKLLVKQSGVLAGVDIARRVFHKIDPSILLEVILSDGQLINPGDVAFFAAGRVQSLLKSERLVLNIMQRMSGIATQTAEYVKLVEGTGAIILDTRKTTPGSRVLDKLAVKIGGGQNHRMGLFDMIMLKDNHIDFAGGIGEAVSRVKEYLQRLGKNLPIEVEVRTLADLEIVLSLEGITRVMFDNFGIEQTIKAVAMVGGRIETESSGGITRDTIRGYAETGVTYISVGALTHQIKSLDLSLKAI
ncbi:MAG TPA: carboxylating nicotinate-nucleotide diphosphorylase [Williamwhitmania sp.]|nr:carboxylating nicotinate-nucleotide diphosphorylase [Williamwhitmania sp.]